MLALVAILKYIKRVRKMVKISCPKCGEVISISISGRKKLNLPVKIIYDALWDSGKVGPAAEKIGCSRAYIYAELAKFGTTPKDVIEGRWKPPARSPTSQPAKLKTSQK